MKISHLSIVAIGLLSCLFLTSSGCEKDTVGHRIPDSRHSEQPSTGGQDESQGGGQDSKQEEPATLCTDIGQTPMIIAYYTENSTVLPDPTLVTHINYAHGRFADPTNGDGGIVISKPDLMEKVIALKKQNPKLKVLLMIGGWGMRADGFSMMARDPKKRTTFCNSVKSHIDRYGLDGVDIDWEYPTRSAEGTGYHSSDTKNFNLVLAELRAAIGTGKIISFASSSSAQYVDWPTAMKYLDYVNVMTYDMGCAPDRHNSPLYRSSTFNQTSDDESVDKHCKAGVPLGRINLGVPFYGKAEKNPVNKIYEYEVKYNEMYDILNNDYYKARKLNVKGKNIRHWDSVAKVPYLTDESGHILLSYDDPESCEWKGKYVASKHLLGAMFWEYRHDDSNQSCLRGLLRGVYGKETVIQQ